MSRIPKWLPAVLVVTGFALLAAPRDAHAALRITSVTPANVVLLDVTDQGGGDTDLATPGRIMLGTAGVPVNIGGLEVTDSTHVSNANFAVPAEFLPLDDFTFSRLNSRSDLVFNNPADGSGPITQIVTIEDSALANAAVPGATGNGTGFGPSFSNFYNIVMSAGGEFVTDPTSTFTPGASSITIEWWANAANSQRPFTAAGAVAAPTGTLLETFTVVQNAQQQTLNVPTFTDLFDAGPDTQFGMTLRFILTLADGTRLNVRSQTATATAVVPEPSTALAALAGLPLLGIGAWLRRRKSA